MNSFELLPDVNLPAPIKKSYSCETFDVAHEQEFIRRIANGGTWIGVGLRNRPNYATDRSNKKITWMLTHYRDWWRVRELPGRGWSESDRRRIVKVIDNYLLRLV